MEMKSQIVRLNQLMPLFCERLAAGQKVTFSPQGISMLPMLRQGVDTVTLAQLPEKLKKYDLPLYQRRDGQYVLHRVVETGETYTCIGDGQFVYEKGLTHQQMIAVVTSFTRGQKEYSVTDWRYRLYCRVWHYSRPVRGLFARCLGGLRARVKRLFH